MNKKDTKDIEKLLNVARYIVFLNDEKFKTGITHKKLQKLLYYSQAWSLGKREEPLFENKIEAWIHGSVVPDLYFYIKEKYNNYSQNTIIEKGDVLMGDISSKDDVTGLNNDEKVFIQEIFNAYGGYNGDDLEILNHQEELWQKARNNADVFEPTHTEITQKDMQEFYKNQ